MRREDDIYDEKQENRKRDRSTTKWKSYVQMIIKESGLNEEDWNDKWSRDHQVQIVKQSGDL